ncbi:MAG: holo-ACP synthase [Phycisphaerae bacterium]
MSQIVNHGIDLVECARIRELVERYGERFLHRIFTEKELAYCLPRRRKWEHLAGRFAAKEAILKVLGTGWRDKIAWTDMEITNDPTGMPHVTLTGESAQITRKLNIDKIILSISHTEHYATASALGLGK